MSVGSRLESEAPDETIHNPLWCQSRLGCLSPVARWHLRTVSVGHTQVGILLKERCMRISPKLAFGSVTASESTKPYKGVALIGVKACESISRWRRWRVECIYISCWAFKGVTALRGLWKLKGFRQAKVAFEGVKALRSISSVSCIIGHGHILLEYHLWFCMVSKLYRIFARRVSRSYSCERESFSIL